MLDTHAIAAAAAPAAAASGGAWLVGGAVRDGLLHRECDDVDLAVAGDAESFARTLAAALDASAFSYSERFSAWRIVCEGGHIDVTSLRGPTIADDLRGRDFTVNAMARALAAPGEGASALGAGDGHQRIGCRAGRTDRPLRRPRRPARAAPRGVRSGRLRRRSRARGAPGAPAPRARPDRGATGQSGRPEAAAGRLATASPERLEHELSTLLGLPCVASALRSLADLGALEVVLPEVAACRGVTQNPYHHLDVFDHTLEALSFLSQVVTALGGERYLAPPAECGLPGAPALAPLAWAVLLHDVGKPLARQVDDQGRVMFLSHDRLGEQIARDVCRRLRMSRRFEQFLAELVRQHLRLGFLVREMPLTRRALVRFRRDAQPFVFEAIVLSLADRVATRGERTPPQSLARHFRIAARRLRRHALAAAPPAGGRRGHDPAGRGAGRRGGPRA